MPVYMPTRHASGSHRIDRVFHENIVLSTSGAQRRRCLRQCEIHGARREFCCERLYVFVNMYGRPTVSRTAAVLTRAVPYARKVVEVTVPPARAVVGNTVTIARCRFTDYAPETPTSRLQS